MADTTHKSNDDLIREALTKIAEKAVNTGLTAEQFESIMNRVGITSAEAMKSSLKPENPDHPHISAFSYPEGDVKRPKPKLARKTFFNGMEEREERLTPHEIDAYNSLKGRREARGGLWKSEVRNEGKYNEELYVWIPCETVDQRMNMPSGLTLIMHELNGGASTADVSVLLRQIEELKGLAVKGGATAAQLEAALMAQ